MLSPPRTLEPMLATLGPLPLGDSWSFEPKWDGFRALCFLDRGRASLSADGATTSHTLCPGVSALAAADMAPAVLDGEIVAFPNGEQSFEALQGGDAATCGGRGRRLSPSICCGSMGARSKGRRTWSGASSSKACHSKPVGVRNSDQGLALRLRNAAAQTSQHLSRRHGREHPAFGCLALGAKVCGASRDRPECVRLNFICIRFAGRCPRGHREGAIGPSLAGGQLGAKPQVTGVIGVSDPYTPTTKL